MDPLRFRGARRVELLIGGRRIEVVVAERYLLRLRGLAGLKVGQQVPLLFPCCRSLHTFAMSGPIDVVWLEVGAGEGAVLAIAGSVRPRRLVRAPRGGSRRRTAALELPAGEAERLGLAASDPITLATPWR